MEQINNEVLVSAIDHMKTLPEFLKFVKLCENRLRNFEKNHVFNYKSKDSKGEEKTLVYDFMSNKLISNYVSILTSNINEIICCDSRGLIKWKKEFNKIDFSSIDLNVKKGFYIKIRNLLQYKELRSGEDKLLFHFYSKLNVRACVYCNSQHVVLLKSSKKARLQADHNLPKAEFPHLSISLSNLYPSCNNCNHLKKEDDIMYNLYYVDIPKRELTFKLDTFDIVKFCNNKLTENDLNIIFDQGSTKLEDVLNINEIYENHKDYAFDLLRKHRIYTKSYVSGLSHSFGTLLGTNEDLINRLIFGSTLKDEDINQRVFSKLIIDLKRQLDELDNLSSTKK